MDTGVGLLPLLRRWWKEPTPAVYLHRGSDGTQVLRREDFDVLQGEAQQVLEGNRVGIGLRHVAGEPGALIVLRDPPPQNFSVDCEVFLEPGGLLNILFGFNRENWQGYMARVDTRPYPPEGDCILWMEDGHHGVWSPEMQAKVNSPAGQWFPVSIRVEDGSCVFFRQEQPLLRLAPMKAKIGTIGFFTELATSHVANVRVRSLPGS